MLKKIVHHSVGSAIIQWLLLGMLNFGLGGLGYYFLVANNLFTKAAPKQDIGLAVLNNFIEVTFAWIFLQFFITYQSKIRRVWLKYACLSIAIYFLQHILWFLMFKEGETHNFFYYLFSFNIVGFVFEMNLLISTNLVFFFFRRDKIKTQEIDKQRLQLLELQHLKTKAELEALQAKISPHFLYNALNSVVSLIHTSPDKAEEMVLLLAHFFRHTTNATSAYHAMLVRELEIVKIYLDVEKVRFDDRLQYHIELASPELNELYIPQFLLQPLIENCIKHSLSKMPQHGHIKIMVQKVKLPTNLQTAAQTEELCIEVHDNGVPFPEQLQQGYGLRSTQEKLTLLGGTNARMEILNGSYKAIRLYLSIKVAL